MKSIFHLTENHSLQIKKHLNLTVQYIYLSPSQKHTYAAEVLYHHTVTIQQLVTLVCLNVSLVKWNYFISQHKLLKTPTAFTRL